MAERAPSLGAAPTATGANLDETHCRPTGEPQEPSSLRCTLTIVNRRGLHARASARFVQTAEAFEAELTISRDGLTVGGQSIMGLMMLAAAQGTTIEVCASGAQAAEALEAIRALVDDGFGEEI